MPAFAYPPASHTVESFADEIENAWKSVVCSSSPRDQHAKPNFESNAHAHVFRGSSLETTSGWRGSQHSREFAYKAPPAASTAKHIRVTGGRNAKLRGQIVLGIRAQTVFAEGSVRSDSSSSSDEDQIYGVNRISRQCGRTRRMARIVSGSPQKVEHAASRSDGRNADPAHGGPTDAHPKQTEGGSSRGMVVSKSESHNSTIRKRALCLPRVQGGLDRDDLPKKRPSKNRESSLPPLGGTNTLENDITREIDEHLANLRASPRERQALEERVLHHLSKGSKRRARYDGGPTSGEGDVSLCSNDSVGSLTSDGELTPGRGKKRSTHRRRKGRPDGAVVGATRRRLSASARASEASVRVLAQTLHAQDVVRRKRAIEEERMMQLRDRSALLADKARQRSDRAAGRNRAEALAVMVVCATRFAKWQQHIQSGRDERLRKEMSEASAARIQKAWCRSHMRRTWDGVRASAPAVQSTVLNMRNKAAMARAAVARRHRTQAADLIRIALRAGTRTLFRMRITYYREKIMSCQRHFTSFRQVSNARTKLLACKWTRLVNTLDGERFSTYSQHLRDMYNFDPSAVEKFLKEMRVLATNGQNAAYGMRAKVGAKGLVNGIAASPRAECAAATVSEYQGSVTVHGADTEGGPAVEGSSRRAQTRVKQAQAGEEREEVAAASKMGGKQGRAAKRGKAKLALGWQKRVAHTHSDIQAQAALMCKRGLKHKEISGALRDALIDDLLSQARRIHKDWCWNALRKAREKKGQGGVVNLRDIKSALGTYSSSAGEGMMEAKAEGLTAKNGRDVNFGQKQGMLLLTMVTDDVLMRCIILAERIEACVAADDTGCGSLSPDELRDIFVVNRHPAQHESVAAKEVKAQLQVWAKRRGISAPVIRRASAGKTATHYAHQLHQFSPARQEANRVQQVPYFDFMGVAKGGILTDICVPEGQRLACGEADSHGTTSALHSKSSHLPPIE